MAYEPGAESRLVYRTVFPSGDSASSGHRLPKGVQGEELRCLLGRDRDEVHSGVVGRRCFLGDDELLVAGKESVALRRTQRMGE